MNALAITSLERQAASSWCEWLVCLDLRMGYAKNRALEREGREFGEVEGRALQLPALTVSRR